MSNFHPCGNRIYVTFDTNLDHFRPNVMTFVAISLLCFYLTLLLNIPFAPFYWSVDLVTARGSRVHLS